MELYDRQCETREQALERLFGEHHTALRAFLRMRFGVRDEMEDIVQEVFIRLARLDNLPQRMPAGDRSNRSYIFAVANNLIVDMERSKARQRNYLEKFQAHGREEDEVLDDTPESITLAVEELEQFKKVILGLKPTWREAFILNRFKHKSYSETAIEMGVTVKQVERFIKNALVRVRKAAIEITGED